MWPTTIHSLRASNSSKFITEPPPNVKDIVNPGPIDICASEIQPTALPLDSFDFPERDPLYWTSPNILVRSSVVVRSASKVTDSFEPAFATASDLHHQPLDYA